MWAELALDGVDTMLWKPRNQLTLCVVVIATTSLFADSGEGPANHGEWPFQPPLRSAVPDLNDTSVVRNPIDAFIAKRLEEQGLRMNDEADRRTLLRRVTFDLTGLPPTPDEQRRFLEDTSPEAYDKLVDRLLTSPHYGVRWGQHWLDVVRYAETEGFKADTLRPNAFRYRDYVIRALNNDIGYDQFIRQQLAGDELERDNPDALIATGLLRLYPDENNAANLFQRRQEILDDVTETTGLAFLGLTMGCAQCHDHKFDEIRQTDYFRLQAFFAPFVERDDLLAATPQQRKQFREQLAIWDSATRDIRNRMNALLAEERRESDSYALTKFRSAIQECYLKPAEERTPLEEQIAQMTQRQLAWRFKPEAAVKKLSKDDQAEYAKLERQLRSFDRLKPQPLPVAMAVSDVSEQAPRTYLLEGGNWKNPADEVQPGFPELLAVRESALREQSLPQSSTGRRSSLANWLTDPEHPLTARVIVNRVWHHHFGRGIVASPNDFGVQGEPPTHPELLDWLAVELMNHDWSLKYIHKLIVTSATYRQSSLVDADRPLHAKAMEVDIDNRLLWHARRRRLEGEAIRDAMLLVSGELNQRLYGKSEQPDLPDGISKRYAWQPDKSPVDRNRRSLFVLAKRNMRFPTFDAFDLPDMHNSCGQRIVTTTPTQALLMLNSEQSLESAQSWSDKLIREAGQDNESLLTNAWKAALGRLPTKNEIEDALAFLEATSQTNSRDRTSAVADLCHALFNCNEFIYID